MRRCFLYAWVLWRLLEPNPPEARWEPTSAYDSKEDCEVGLRGEVNKWQTSELPDGKYVERLPDGNAIYSNSTKGQLVLMQLWRCFPDTIDPRPRR